MKDLARAEEALRNAHAAGDVASAKKIAMFIRDNQASQESGFSQNMQERGAKFANIAQGAEGYGKTVPEKLYQGTMNVVGTGADVIGEGASKLYQGFKSIIPEKGRQRLESDEARLQEMLAPLTPYAEKYQQNVQAYQKQEPRTAANLEATRELLNIVPLGFKPVRDAVSGGLVKGGEALGNVTKDVALSPIEGMENIAKGVAARSGEELIEGKGKFKQTAGTIRDVVKKEGVVISPAKAQGMALELDKQLEGVELIPELTPKTSAIVSRIKDVAKSDQGITLNQLDQYRRLLRAARDEDTVAASAVRRAIDNTVNTLQRKDLLKGNKETVGLLNLFRKEYTQASKFEDVADIIARADGDVNKIKSGLNRFLKKEENTRGWSTEELNYLKKAAKYSVPEKILKGLGRFGYDPGNVFLPLVGSGMVGFGVGAPAAISLGLTGTASRQLYKVLGRGKAEKLLQRIESGSKIGRGEASKLPPNVVKELRDKNLILEGQQ